MDGRTDGRSLQNERRYVVLLPSQAHVQKDFSFTIDRAHAHAHDLHTMTTRSVVC